jgi:predicted dehydrogenase
MKAPLKRAAKRILKAGYRAVDWALPPRVRSEVQAYRRFRYFSRLPPSPTPPAQAATPPTGGPYWERRELPALPRRLVRVGMVGAGNYAQHHLKVLTDLEAVSVTALLSAGGPRGRETAERYSIPFLTHDRATFLARDDIDCFVIVASAEHLYSLALDCLATGKPVLMEKPPGTTSAETAALVRQAETHATFGMVCMNRRFYSVIEHGLAQLALYGPIRSAMLEIPLSITAERQSRRLSEWDYDHFYVRNSIHGVDLLRYIMGNPLAVHSLAWPNHEFKNAAASFTALLEYEHGVVASVVDVWDTPQSWRLKVVAESGWIEFEPLENGWYFEVKQPKIALRRDPVDVEYRAGVYAQDLHFIDAVRRGARPARPACLLPDAYQSMKLVEQILASNLRSEPTFVRTPAEPNGAIERSMVR